MSRGLIRLLFVVLVVGGGLAIGFLTAPGGWYASLVKPPFNPPNWAFGPVWTLLYVMIAVAGWRTYEGEGGGWAMKLWGTQLGLNFLWTPVFFSAHRIGLALVILMLLLVVILAFIVSSWRRDPIRAGLFIPYAVWVGFASLLNGWIWALN
ncbi:MAG: TspO/MBR family protein [Rhizomicrobium sp.]